MRRERANRPAGGGTWTAQTGPRPDGLWPRRRQPVPTRGRFLHYRLKTRRPRGS